ncbi:AfsR/SARP family transcriptional regulator [Nocardiopsis halotolerans]|uniref:AfsR/SARP family transcriptional regulator n=1 Tax=Nocardiopsis halotolerans TaxID=124252 RepID=UPI001F4CF442|nr:AfsR/SARP family transcriptional regulator [Nocardiopsis halotolerans]
MVGEASIKADRDNNENRPPVLFRVLGPVEVEGEDGPVRVPPGRQQVVLSALLLELNHVVSTDRLVDVLWHHDPPETARTQVQICVSRLRRLLPPAIATIHTRPPGYVLSAPAESVDAQLHRLGMRDAAELVREGRDTEAAALLRSTVALWRGPALSGTDNEVLRSEALRLQEERMDAIEAYLDIELRLGHHARLVSEITALVEAHPLRENLRAQLMLALYRSGRQAEALEVYRVGRELLVDELGLDPGTRLRDMESAILAGDPGLDPPVAAVPPPEPSAAAPPGREDGEHTGAAPEAPPRAPSRAPAPEVTPYQLPTAAADFVGRDDVVATVEDALVGAEGAVGVAVLVGRPGVGKSATAVRVARVLADDHYPDGQLYCDMRGTRETHLEPADVLARFLRALGVPGQAIPEDVDERAAMYRGILAARRVLVVLDDAADEGQIAPLVPGGAGCGVIVTSRARLTGLPGSTLVEMDILSDDASLELLARVLGRNRVEAEPEAARALVHAVGQLPLALRIVAARLAARPHWPLAGMVNRLADERRRLDELSHGDMTVRASLSLTHDGLRPRTSRVFALLGLTEAPTIPAWAAGALLDDDSPFPSDLAEPLVDAHMLDVVGVDAAGEPLYRFHDLVRDYAREQLIRNVTADTRRAAVERLLGGWLALLDEANRRLLGGDYLQVRGDALRWVPPDGYVDRLLADPYTWLEAERANLRHAVSQAADEGLHQQCWELAVGFSMFLMRRGYVDDLAELYDRAEPVVTAAGDRLGAAALAEGLANVISHRYGQEERRRLLEGALAEFVELGEVRGEALVRTHLAFMDRHEENDASALAESELALEGFLKVGDLGGQRRSLMLMGHLRALGGDIDRGREHLNEARSLAERSGDVRGRAQVLRLIGQTDLLDGEHASALRNLGSALDLVRDMDDPVGEALLLHDLARAYTGGGNPEEARPILLQAREIYERVRDEQGVTDVERALAEVDS